MSKGTFVGLYLTTLNGAWGSIELVFTLLISVTTRATPSSPLSGSELSFKAEILL